MFARKEEVATDDATEGPRLVDRRAPRIVETLDEWRHGSPSGTAVEQGLIHPFWADDMLLLARHVVVAGEPFVQGCWLDWEAIEQRLLADVRPLLPEAKLVPDREGLDPGEDSLRLVALPFHLVPGDVDVAAAPEGISAIRQTLLVASLAVFVAVLAVAVLLRTILLFSARRADFVSAVTHELRTPLTTLRMYADMLADGRVSDDAKRQRYYGTLKREADRLALLVDNVLAYSRLEARATSGRREEIVVDDVVARCAERCRERTTEAGMSLDVRVDDDARSRRVSVDVAALEQIVFNLVDNACKYAQRGTTATEGDDVDVVELTASADVDRVVLTVRDHGPGIVADEVRSIFEPFSQVVARPRRQAGGRARARALSSARSRDGSRAAIRAGRWRRGGVPALDADADCRRGAPMSPVEEWIEIVIPVEPGTEEDAAARILAPPLTGVECGDGHLVTHVLAANDSDELRARVLDIASGEVGYRRFSAGDYRDLWRESWRPFRVGRICVAAPGQEVALREDDVRLDLEPGGAFGTGRHASTRTSILGLQRMMSSGDRVLDAGCGSGILGVSAALLGAGEVVGFDHDPNTVPFATDLARRNHVDDRCRFERRDLADLGP